jgi:hypothetical protein
MSAPSETPALARLRPVREYTPTPLDWLWPSRLALGKLAILDGDPGLGKSLVALDLCARLSTGRPFPDGSPGPGVQNALVLCAEDDVGDTIRPRLQALGADLDRVFVLPQGRDEAGGPLYFPRQLPLLEEMLTQTQARLVVIDPIIAFLDPGLIDSSDQNVRRALSPLAHLATRRGCAVLMIRHLNKSGGGRSLYRGAGSIGFLGVCRSGWLIARNPEQPTQCVLAQVKNNLAPAQPSLAYTVTCRESEPPSLAWLGTTAWTADQLLGGFLSLAGKPRDRASDFLESFLADGPRTTREIWSAAREQHLSERTLHRAKQELEIRSMLVGIGDTRRSYWLLPEQVLPEAVAPKDPECDLERWLAPLREKYPPSTPLDEL